MSNKKGFTLIELLVVMGILGILMAVTILVINPAEYLKRSRDTQRINDLGAINSAVGIYMANGGTLATDNKCYVSSNAVATVTTKGGLSCGVASTTTKAAPRSTSAGWVNGIDFTSATYFPGGAPFAALPVDPLDGQSTNTGYEYIWASNGSAYEIDATGLESTYYANQGTAANDGGGAGSAAAYEVGTSLSIIN